LLLLEPCCYYTNCRALVCSYFLVPPPPPPFAGKLSVPESSSSLCDGFHSLYRRKQAKWQTLPLLLHDLVRIGMPWKGNTFRKRILRCGWLVQRSHLCYIRPCRFDFGFHAVFLSPSNQKHTLFSKDSDCLLFSAFIISGHIFTFYQCVLMA
jgi:hypothetical protein